MLWCFKTASGHGAVEVIFGYLKNNDRKMVNTSML